jgi:hypothetical protein
VRTISVAVAELRPEDAAILISAIDATPIEQGLKVSSGGSRSRTRG